MIVLSILLLIVGIKFTIFALMQLTIFAKIKTSVSFAPLYPLPILFGSIGILLITGSILLFSFPDKQNALEKNKISTIKSSIFLVANLLLLLPFLKIVKAFEGMFLTLNLQSVPIMTRIALISPYLFIIIAVALVAKEFLKNKQKTLVINGVTILILIFVVIPVLIIGLFLPMHQVTQHIR